MHHVVPTGPGPSGRRPVSGLRLRRRTRALVAAAGLALLVAGPAGSHPHIYIDSGLQAVFDDAGRLAAVRVIWAYDDFYSLLTLEDRGLDPDADGILTDAEVAELDGFDMNWDADYSGDLFVSQNGVDIPLSRPLDHATTMDRGRIVTLHTRALEPRPDPADGPIVFRIYDATFYTAYTVALPTRIEGRVGCTADLFRPDLDAANQALLEALAEYGAEDSLEMDFPAVGANFADEVRLQCAPPS